MSLEDISTLYAEDLAVTADEDVRHPDKILEHSEENCKFAAEIRVLSQLVAQMMRKMDEQRDRVDGQTVVLLKLQTDKMAADLRDLRNIFAETREKDSMHITELVQVVKELKEEISARPNELVQVVKELKEEISARPNDSPTELVQVVKELKEEISARPNDSHTELVQVVKELKEEISARPNELVQVVKELKEEISARPNELVQVVKELKEEISARPNELVQVVKELKEEISARPNELVQVVQELKEEMTALRNFARPNDSPSELAEVVRELKEEMAALRNFARPNDSPTELIEVVKELKEEMSALRILARQNDSQDFYRQMLGAGTRHPPSEDSDYDESIINVTSLYPGSEDVVKLTNFLEKMKSQQDREVSKGTDTEQLPTDSSEGDALAKNEDGSGVIINNTREDNVKMINLIPETVKDSKFANFQEEMQGELHNGISNKGIELLLGNESVEDFSAMDDRKSVVINTTEDNVVLRTLNPETVGGEMQGELDNGIVHKVAESTVPMKEDIEDSIAKGDGSSVILDKNTEEVMEQKPTKENDENVEDKDQEDSVAVTKIAEVEIIENSSVCLEMEDDAISASPQQKMQSKLDGCEVNKATEQLATNERKDNASAMEDRDSILLNESIKEDVDKNVSFYPESEDDKKLANSDEDIQSKPASKGQLPTKEKDDVEDRNQEDSIASTKIVEEDTVENSSESLKREDDAKSVISQQEIRKKLDGGEGNKVTKQLATDERKDTASAMGVRDFVVHNEDIDIKEDKIDKNISLCPESEDDDKLANSVEEIQSKLASEEQLQIKESGGVAQNKPVKESVSITNNTGKGTADNGSSQRLETVEEARSANSQQEMQRKLDVIEQLPTNKSAKYVQAKDKDDSVAITNSTKEDNAKSNSICLKTKGDNKLAQQEMQSKIESGGFGKAETKQLQPTESVKYAPSAEDDRDSVVIKDNTKDDRLKFTFLYQETEEAAKLEDFQEEMQSKVHNGTKQLIGEGCVKDALELDDDIGNNDVKKSLSHLKAEDVNFKLAIQQEKLQREVDEEVKTQQGYTVKQTDIQENQQTVPGSSNPVSCSLDLVENEECIESTQKETKYTNESLKQIEQGQASEEPQAYVNDEMKGLEEYLTIPLQKKVTTAKYQEKSNDIQEQAKQYSTVGVNTKESMIKSAEEENIQMTNANETCLFEEKYQEQFQAYHVPDVDANIYVSTDNILSETSDESCMKYKPHDVEVGSVKNGNQQSNTVKTYKYELEHSISKVKQDGSPGLSKIPRPLNSQYQTMLVSNLPKNNQDSHFLGENDKSRLPKTEDLHIIDDDVNQTKKSQENRKYTVEKREEINGVAQQHGVKYRPRNVSGDIYQKIQQDKSTEWEDFPKNMMDTTQTDTGKRKYVQEKVRSGISNDRKARTPTSPKNVYRYNDIQQNLSQINRSYLSPSTNVRRNIVIDKVPEDQLSQTQIYSEKVDDKTILNGGKSKQFRSKIPQYQGIKNKGTSSSDEDINPKINQDFYARSTRKTQTPLNRQDYRKINGQTNQINMVDITNLKSEIDMTSSAESLHADLKTNTTVVTRANYRKRDKLSGSCIGNRSQPCKDQNHQILTTKEGHFFQCTSTHVWNKTIGKLKDQRRVTENESGFYNRIEKGPLLDKRSHDERFPKHSNEIGFGTNDMNLESDSQYEMFEHSKQQMKRRDINTTDAVVPQAEDFDVLQRPNYYSSGDDMIGNPIASSTPIIRRLVLEPVATSTPKNREKLPEDNSNQVVPSRNYIYDKVMKSDTGIDFDLKLKCAEIFLGKTVIGEIAFQLNRRMIKIVFQQNTTKFMKDLQRDRDYWHAVQSIHYLIMKETLKADGTQDVISELIYSDRFENLLKHLEKHGYNQKIHEEFAYNMVEKYGTLNCKLSRRQVKEYGLENQDVLEALLYKTAANGAELHNTMMLLNCLRMVVNWDGGPLFIL